MEVVFNINLDIDFVATLIFLSSIIKLIISKLTPKKEQKK